MWSLIATRDLTTYCTLPSIITSVSYFTTKQVDCCAVHTAVLYSGVFTMYEYEVRAKNVCRAYFILLHSNRLNIVDDGIAVARAVGLDSWHMRVHVPSTLLLLYSWCNPRIHGRNTALCLKNIVVKASTEYYYCSVGGGLAVAPSGLFRFGYKFPSG